MKTYHVDGGARIEPPNYKPHDSYITIVDDKNKLIHHSKIGDVWSFIAEFYSIKWVVDNVKKRPLRITSDCTTAISWSQKGSSPKSSFQTPPLNLTDITLEYQHNNLAAQYNARFVSPKYDKAYYVQRWLETGKKSKALRKLEARKSRIDPERGGKQELKLF